MAERVRLVLFDQRMYHGNGIVIKWARLLVTHFGQHARRYAPARSGQLRAGIRSSARTTGPRQVEGSISSNAPHTMYVIKGTTGPIMTTRRWNNPGGARDAQGRLQPGYVLRVSAGGGYPAHFAEKVSGQAPSNFLFKAWRRTGRTHSSIRGTLPPF